jgi:hypothetical protein
MQNLSLIHFVKQPLHVLTVFISHHQEIFTVYLLQLVTCCSSGQEGTGVPSLPEQLTIT